MLQTHGIYGQTLALHTSQTRFCAHVCTKLQLAGTPRPASSLLLALAHPGSLALPSIHCPAPAALSGTLSHPLALLNHSVIKCLESQPDEEIQKSRFLSSLERACQPVLGKIMPGQRRVCARCISSSWSLTTTSQSLLQTLYPELLF